MAYRAQPHTTPTRRWYSSIAASCLLAVAFGIALLFFVILAATCTWGQSNEFPDSDVVSGKLVRLTHNDSTDRNPAWSPRGDKIAFECLREDRIGFWHFSRYSPPADSREVRNWPIHTYSVPSNICVMNADGSGRKQLTDESTEDYGPAWSPDGSKIAFASWRKASGRSHAIYVMNADGSEFTRITGEDAPYHDPTWSPDGNRIAYTSWRDQSYKIVVIDADGSNPTVITDGSGSHSQPTWSPDGSQVAFIRTTDDGADIYVMNPDGTDQSLLLDASVLYEERPGRVGPAYVQSPAWSPDGNRIAFVSDVEDSSARPNYEIFVANFNRPGVDRLTCRRSSREMNPTWSPDGSQLAFESDLTYHPEIHVIGAIERCHR